VTLTADADIPPGDYFGKSVEDLQEDIEVGEDGVTGTLKYVSDYTGFSEDEELQEGNFLMLHFDAPGAESITVQLIGGNSNVIWLPVHGIMIARIESTEQSIMAVADYGPAGAVIKEIPLDGLTLESE